jgi:hypothetical protein
MSVLQCLSLLNDLDGMSRDLDVCAVSWRGCCACRPNPIESTALHRNLGTSKQPNVAMQTRCMLAGCS